MTVHRANGGQQQTNYATAMSVRNEVDDGIFRIEEGMIEWETQADWYKNAYAAANP